MVMVAWCRGGSGGSAHFGDATDALDYAADLVAYSSTIYQDETDTSLEIEYTSIWTTPSDPWDETDCELMLYEFRECTKLE